MANVQSAEKRNRQRLKRRARNLLHLTATRTLVKRAAASVASGDGESSKKAVAVAVRQLDKAAQKGVIRKKTAARKISRLTRAIARKASAPPSKTGSSKG